MNPRVLPLTFLLFAMASAGVGCAPSTDLECVDGTWDHDSNPATACVAWTACEPGSFVAANGTVSSDRVCAGCGSGSFSALANASSCVAWTVCEPGSFVSRDGSTTRDQVCAACPDGTLSQSANQSACTRADECAGGTEQIEPATATTPPVCEACEAGTHCAGGSAPKTACADGTWDHDENPATACVAWTACLPGSRVVQDGGATSNRACAPCESGSFSATANAVSCSAWTECEAGEFVSTEASSTFDRVCSACEAGSWDHDAKPATACIPQTTCIAGTFAAHAGSATTDRECEACVDGTFSSTANAARCEPWSTCEPGSFLAEDGSAVSDRLCPACEAGYSSSEPNAPTCFAVATAVELMAQSTCALLGDGRVKCWGFNVVGQLGLGDTANRGDEPGEMGEALPAVDLGRGRTATALAMGSLHACALLDDGGVKCWGSGTFGQLGQVNTANRGVLPGSMGDALPPVDLGTGRTAKAISARVSHTCALLDSGEVKCWGDNYYGQLGQGDRAGRGDEPGEMGDALPAVDLGTGRTATAISAGTVFVCALLDDGSVKCWGDNRFGQLGVGDTANRGDGPGEMGDALPAVDLGTGRTAKALTTGYEHACALLDDDSVKCWGGNTYGQLGLGDSATRGDGPGEMGDALPAVDLGTGRTAKFIAAGVDQTCAVLDDDRLKCWGRITYGVASDGDPAILGDEPGEMGDALPSVDLGTGRTPKAIAMRGSHACALLEGGRVTCWGLNNRGQLGLGDTADRGDEPGEMGDALPVVDLGTRP